MQILSKSAEQVPNSSYMKTTYHSDVIGYCSPKPGSGQSNGDVHACIIVLAIVVDNCSAQLVLAQHWEQLKSLLLA